MALAHALPALNFAVTISPRWSAMTIDTCPVSYKGQSLQIERGIGRACKRKRKHRLRVGQTIGLPKQTSRRLFPNMRCRDYWPSASTLRRLEECAAVCLFRKACPTNGRTCLRNRPTLVYGWEKPCKLKQEIGNLQRFPPQERITIWLAPMVNGLSAI